jgi:hypothetical protein
MFFKLSVLALVVPFVLGLTLDPLNGATSGGQVTIKWTSVPDDPATFSIFLVNTVFHNNFGIANTVQTSAGSLTLQLPAVPATDGYTLMATANSDINQVFATSASFSIGDETSTTASSTTAVSTSQSQTSSRISSTSTRSTTPVSSTPTSQFGSTVSNTNTGSPSSPSTSGAPAQSSGSGSGASLPVRFSLNKGALSAVFLSAIAGAVVVAL